MMNTPTTAERRWTTGLTGWLCRHVVMALTIATVAAQWIPSMPSALAADSARPIKLVAFGDSLTAGFQLPPSASFPAQLEAALVLKGYKVEVINAGVSGDTTGAGLARIAWAVPDDAEGVILELGANDALRGLPPASARKNLSAIMDWLKARKIDVLVAGMLAPRNWGEAYVKEFEAIFPELAAEAGALHYPFFLEGVALRPDLDLGDGLHPNTKGVAEIVQRIMPLVETLIKRIEAKRAAAKKP